MREIATLFRQMLGTNFPDYLSASRSGAAGVAAANRPNPELAYIHSARCDINNASFFMEEYRYNEKKRSDVRSGGQSIPPE
jgi:hypothetical protein